MTDLQPLPADGLTARWADGDEHHIVALTWENEAWTAVGTSALHRLEYVVRLTAQWQVSQFLLFRDLDEADLWLGTDGRGRWGEVNGAHRPDLDGGSDLTIAGAPFVHAIPIRRLPLQVGDAAEVSMLAIDHETLGVVTRPVRYERLGERRWRHRDDTTATEFDVDRYGLPLDVGDALRAD